jgi:hypothetical protein
MYKYFINVLSLLSKGIPLFPLILIGLIVLFISVSSRQPIQVYLAAFGGALIIGAASIEMFVYLQRSRRRYLGGRAFFEGHSSSRREPDQTRKPPEPTEPPINTIRFISKEMRDRLEEEVEALGSRANINLIIGNAISVIGLSVLAYFVFTIPPNINPSGFYSPEEIENFAKYFITRLSLVAFIEVFAFFFLRIYRHSIFEIKYFQNETTNAEFRILALEAALMIGDKEIIKKICTEMSKIERNFILKKGETTISLRGEELEQLSDKSLIGLIDKVLDEREKKERRGGWR